MQRIVVQDSGIMKRVAVALLLFALVGMSACGDNQPAPAPIAGAVYEDLARGFRLTVPAGWTVNPSSSVTQHYLDLCFSVSNTDRSDLRVGDELRPDGADYNEDTVARQLEPGTAYLDIGRWGGPPGVGTRIRTDFEGTRPCALIEAGVPQREDAAALTSAGVTCRKWGRFWTVQLYLREPVSAQTRREAEFVLRSIEFVRPDDPVWAADVAWSHLPTEAKALGDWPLRSRANHGGCRTDVERVPDGFRVTFTDTSGEIGGQVRNAWSFIVRPDGSVEPEE